MLRTCLTTIELFKEHPEKENIKFVVYPVCKESMHLCNDLMRGPFKEQIYDKFKDQENTCGLRFDFTYVLGAYGCESTMQLNIISDIETLKVPYSYTRDEEMEDNMGSMNQVVGNVLQSAYDNRVRIEMYEAAYQRAQVCKDFMRAYFNSTMN